MTVFRVSTKYYLKYSVYNKKMKETKKPQENLTDFKVDIIYMFKELNKS